MNEIITSDNIRALSWKAPFAQLMLLDKIETRTWPTNYRGLVLICCSKNPYSANKVIEMAGEKQFNMIMNAHPSTLNYEFHLGMAIAIGRLIDCRPMTEDDQDRCYLQFKAPWTETKISKGGKVRTSKKRLWCHVYADIRPIKPFPFKGGQGWKRLTDEQIQKIKDPDPLILHIGYSQKVNTPVFQRDDSLIGNKEVDKLIDSLQADKK